MLFRTRKGQVTGVLNISVVFYRQTLQSSGVFVTFNFHNPVNTVCRMAALILKMMLAIFGLLMRREIRLREGLEWKILIHTRS